jgi:hypothetical protein
MLANIVLIDIFMEWIPEPQLVAIVGLIARHKKNSWRPSDPQKPA